MVHFITWKTFNVGEAFHPWVFPRKAADKGIARYRIAGSEEKRKAEEARARGDHKEADEWEMRAAAKQTGEGTALERIAEPDKGRE
jgi:hypothetical protein